MSSPEDDCQSKDPDFNPEESIVTKRKGRKARASKFPNFVEHAAKQKLEKLQIKKEIKKQEKNVRKLASCVALNFPTTATFF